MEQKEGEENDQTLDWDIPTTWDNSHALILGSLHRRSLQNSIEERLSKVKALTASAPNLLDLCQIVQQDSDWLWKVFEQTKCQKEARCLLTQTCVKQNFAIILKNFLKCVEIDEVSSGLRLDMPAWKCMKKVLLISWILSDASAEFCGEVLKFGLLNTLSILLSAVSNCECALSSKNVFIVKFILGILHNTLRHVQDSRNGVREIFAVENLQNLIKTYKHVPMICAKSIITISYVITESENEQVMADNAVLTFLFDVLRDALLAPDHLSRKFGMCVTEILQGLNNLAINDTNKVTLMELGALPIYVGIAQGGSNIFRGGSEDPEESWVDQDESEVVLAVSGLWKLSFHSNNRVGMRSDKQCMEVLHMLEYGTNPDVCHAARGALWELYQRDGLKIDTSLESICPHVMISYQWDSQATMIKVKDMLKIAGYKVWMDVEHMTGSTLEAMSLAVEGAAVVLICMSQKYKASPSCRSEAEYTYKLRKPFIPLRLEANYNPDGWLGMLVGTRLYFDFSEDKQTDIMLSKLVKELGERGRMGPGVDSTDGASGGTPGYNAKVTGQPPIRCEEWTTKEVSDWLKTVDVSTNEKWRFLDGHLLSELREIQHRAPEYFYTVLKTDFCLDFVNILKFSKALRHL